MAEDSLITGLLRERVGAGLISLQPGPANLWHSFLSLCPWLTVLKLTFFDEIVLNKVHPRCIFLCERVIPKVKVLFRFIPWADKCMS